MRSSTEGDASRSSWSETPPPCDFCRTPLPASVVRRGGRFCSKRCRQSAFRLRQLHERQGSDAPQRFAYADPPYPGMARRFYQDEPSYAGEVDHVALIERLRSGGYAGWALSTSAAALRWVLPLCPENAHVCPWVKPHGVSSKSRGLHNAWEPLIVVPGRERTPGVRDWLRAMPARGGGTLPGRKPLKFCAFLFEALGMLPGDELEDLFPGTGVVGRAWDLLSREALRDVSRSTGEDASRAAGGDVSPVDEVNALAMEGDDARASA